jgi:serine/threonine protein kinase
VELVHCHIAKQPVPPHELNLEIPKAVSDIVMKLLAKTAEERYQSAWGIKADLEECLLQLQNNSQISEFPLGLYDIFDKFQIPQKLYGREAEVETLLAAFVRVACAERKRVSGEGLGREEGTATEGHGDVGNEKLSASVSPLTTPHCSLLTKSEMMLVSGYSGIGKSALVQEIYKPITKRRGYFISGKFDQLQRNIPYSAVVNAFSNLVRQLLTETEASLAQWREKLLAAFGANGQVIIDVIPEVRLKTASILYFKTSSGCLPNPNIP